MRRRILCLAVAALALTGAAASLTAQPNIVVAQNPSCVAACNAQWNQCRIATKGSPSCDGQRQSCMQSCVRR